MKLRSFWNCLGLLFPLKLFSDEHLVSLQLCWYIQWIDAMNILTIQSSASEVLVVISRRKSPEKRMRAWKEWGYGDYFIYRIMFCRMYSVEVCKAPCHSIILHITLYIVLLYTCIWYHLRFKGAEGFVRKKRK